jgi:type I pantothenate kinase
MTPLDNLRRDASPYHIFGREEWALLRNDTPLTLTAEEVEGLRSLDDPVDLAEVEAIYLPVTRLVALYFAATQRLFQVTRAFLGAQDSKTPYIIGLGGSVAVGKSTTARLLRALLERLPSRPSVTLVTTDGFLYPNATLNAQGLMQRKGFPESYDVAALLSFLSDIKAGRRHVSAPLYSHLAYDVLPHDRLIVDQPDILILEGLNVLQTGRPPRDGAGVPFVSDFFDFSIYLDGDEHVIHQWYVERFMRLRQTAFQNPQSYFHTYSSIGDEEAMATARHLWRSINLPNLQENILPTRQRADLILRKGENHRVEEVALRKL